MPTEGSTKEPYDLVRGIAAIDYYEGVENPTIALIVTFIDVDQVIGREGVTGGEYYIDCLLYTSPSPRDPHLSRMPSSA